MNRSAKTGDTPEEIFRVLYPELRRFASAVAPGDVDPDDLVQDALEAVLRSRGLADLENPDAYLRRAIMNNLSNERRSLGRRRDAVRRRSVETSRSNEYPSDLAWLLEIPLLSRAAVYLHHVEGYPHAAVGNLLGLTERAARTRCNRATKRLRTLLEDEG